MTDIVVRRLLIDLGTPFERRWNGGDAFRSAWFNALSLSFPVGEQFFIDSVRNGLKTLPEAERARFAAETQGFIGQEATHRRIHALFNAQLERQGCVNTIEKRAQRRIGRMEGWDPRHAVAQTAAVEHFTAMLAHWVLSTPEALEGAEPRLATLWRWHAAEETEHRSVAFDVYRAMGGDERWRARWMRLVTFFFVTDVTRQTVRNLWHDGALWRWRTWRSAGPFLFGDGGLIRRSAGPWRAYFSPGFHPANQGGALGAQWLRENTQHFAPVAS
jgi:predicted metal-dependent hydrolase